MHKFFAIAAMMLVCAGAARAQEKTPAPTDAYQCYTPPVNGDDPMQYAEATGDCPFELRVEATLGATGAWRTWTLVFTDQGPRIVQSAAGKDDEHAHFSKTRTYDKDGKVLSTSVVDNLDAGKK